MSEPKLSSAFPQLPSGDIEKTAKFLIVRRGPAEIHFWQTETEAAAKKLGSTSSCYIRVEKIDLLFSEFKKRETPFRYELIKQPWGMLEMQIDDPYLNAIKFGEELKN